MTSDEARAKVETLRDLMRDQKRKEKYIRESHDLLIYNKQGGRRREIYPNTRTVDIYYDNRKKKTPRGAK